jgi:hypothetical protein
MIAFVLVVDIPELFICWDNAVYNSGNFILDTGNALDGSTPVELRELSVAPKMQERPFVLIAVKMPREIRVDLSSVVSETGQCDVRHKI